MRQARSQTSAIRAPPRMTLPFTSFNRFAQLVHALEQRVLLDDRLAKREQRGGGQRDWRDRNDRPDARQHLAGEPFELGEARFPRERQDVLGAVLSQARSDSGVPKFTATRP